MTIRSKPPRLVALCGSPKAGKSTIAEMLCDRYGAVIIDDGHCLRAGAAALYSTLGVTFKDTVTQEGKAKNIDVCGKPVQVRALLGDLGDFIEEKYGADLIPEMAIKSIDIEAPFYVIPSCRKNQGLFYQKHNGIVVEVKRPGCFPVYDFDHYNPDIVNFTIVNDASLELLGDCVAAAFNPIFKRS